MKPPRASRGEQAASLVILVLAAGLIITGWLLKPDPRGYGTHQLFGMAECGLMISCDTPCPT